MNEKKFSNVMAIVYILISAVLLAFIVVYTTQTQGSTYSATTEGRAGPISINVVIEDGVIKNAKVVEFPEGERIPESADTIFEQAITAGNANDLDTVSNATMTSNALILGLKQASAEAGIYGSTHIKSAEGFYGLITVQVLIADGIIIGAKVLESPEGEFLPQSVDPIFSKALETGNANSIDVVSGATFTSKALISTLQQAYIEANTDETSLVGHAEGYRGPLSVVVTLENGQITSANLLTITDSEFSLPTAEALLGQAVTMGSTNGLDIIAGATGTSTGIIAALNDAIN